MKNLIIAILIICISGITHAQKTHLKPAIGIAASAEYDSLIAAAGYCCIIESMGRRISPRSVSEADFQKNKALMQQLPAPVFAFNLFLPSDLKVVGPNVNEKAILAYVDSLMHRLSQTNVRMIVWGSGGSRRIPDGFDKSIAIQQMIAIGKKIAAVAQRYEVVIVLENLNSTETNFINTVKEALYIVKQVDHPNLRLNADIYHMLKEGESPAIIAKTRKYLAHVEIAEKERRTAPGVTGADFRPYLRALRKIHYHQKIVIEGSWKNIEDIALPAFQYLQKQIDEVYGK